MSSAPSSIIQNTKTLSDESTNAASTDVLESAQEPRTARTVVRSAKRKPHPESSQGEMGHREIRNGDARKGEVSQEAARKGIVNKGEISEELATVIAKMADAKSSAAQNSGLSTDSHGFSPRHLAALADSSTLVSRLDPAITGPSQFEPVIDSCGALVLEPPAFSGPLNGVFYLACKRVLDVVMSVTLLILLSPVLLLSAVLVKLTDGGAIFYPHTRVGEGGNEFTCYKFRSMLVNAEKMKAHLEFFNSHDDHRTFKIPNDPRVTWIGRWMRRTSVDELPQLWNVLKGEMSVVGPRPPVVSEVENYTWDDMQRLTVRPGLTCIWQVSGRSRLPFPEQLRMDLQYIESRSLALDLKLIVLTVPAVLSADGAY